MNRQEMASQLRECATCEDCDGCKYIAGCAGQSLLLIEAAKMLEEAPDKVELKKLMIDRKRSDSAVLRMYRRQMGLTLEDVAAAIGCTAGTISKLERGGGTKRWSLLEEKLPGLAKMRADGCRAYCRSHRCERGEMCDYGC